MSEDGEEDAVHGGSILEGAHGPGASSDLAEASLDGIGGAHGLALGRGLVAKAGEQFAAIVAHTGDRGVANGVEAIGKAPREADP